MEKRPDAEKRPRLSRSRQAIPSKTCPEKKSLRGRRADAASSITRPIPFESLSSRPVLQMVSGANHVNDRSSKPKHEESRRKNRVSA